MALRGRQAQLARPRLERVEDHHRPVDQLPVALEAVDDVEREAVGGARGDAEAVREALVAHRAQRVPDDLARVAGAVGVVQQQHVEGVDAEPLEAALRRHADVLAVVLRPAQRRIREARIALRPVALGVVEVVTDRPDDAEVRAIDAFERAPEQQVGLAGTVGVGGQQRVEAGAGAQHGLEALFGDRLAEVQVATTAPGSDREVRRPTHRHRVRGAAGKRSSIGVQRQLQRRGGAQPSIVACAEPQSRGSRWP